MITETLQPIITSNYLLATTEEDFFSGKLKVDLESARKTHK